MSDRLVLALDGSTRVCGVALLRLRSGDGSHESRWETVTRRFENDSRGQAKILLRLVDEMIGETGGNPESLGAIVVGTGPGTFTGVRITVATARALSLALSVPVLGVSTLGALAAGAAASTDGVSDGAAPEAAAARLLVPVVDARRGQVFFGLYRAIEGTGGRQRRRWTRSAEYGVCDREALGGLVADEGARRMEAEGGPDVRDFPLLALVVGEDGVQGGKLPAGVVFRAAGMEAERLVVGQERLDEPGHAPQGARLSPWLVENLATGRPAPLSSADAGALGTPEAVKPIYVRCPDADIHITKMKDPWAENRGGL